jgi:hypothetical protein
MIPRLKERRVAPQVSVKVTPDLVGLLLTHHRDRIELCQPFEVTDLAEEFSKRYRCHITEREVCRAMSQALAWVEDFE